MEIYSALMIPCRVIKPSSPYKKGTLQHLYCRKRRTFKNSITPLFHSLDGYVRDDSITKGNRIKNIRNMHGR